MSGPDPDVGDQPEAEIRGARGPAPEVIGAALAVIVLAVIGTSVLASGGGGPGSVGPSPAPTSSSQINEPTASPPVDPTVVNLLRELNGQLADHARSLQRELDRPKFRTADVASLIRQVNAAVGFGKTAVPKLGGFLGPEQPGGRLAALYDAIASSASDTLDASVRNEAAYRAGAGILVKLLAGLPALQAELDALLVAPSPSPSVAPSASASPSQPATPTPSVAPTPTAVSPSTGPSASAVPPPAPDEQIENPDFEAGVGPPWALLVGTGAAATIAADTSGPASGTTAARIDISSGSTAYAGISLQQPGLQLAAGGLYTVTLSARAATEREIRVRVASTSGASYLIRVAPVGTTWAPLTFTFIAPVSDTYSVFEIDLGRSTVTTFIDSVSFRPTAAGG